jgi:excisionase family DNA binding protein
MDKLLDVSEAAVLLGIARQTVYQYVSAKKIPCVKIGSRVLFCERDLEMWVSAQRIPSILEKSKPR